MIVRSPCDVSTIFRRVYIGHARIQEFSSGGGGPGQSDKKSSDNRFFSPQLILLQSNGLFRRKLSFFKVPEGVQHFPGGGGVHLFPRGGGGVQLLIPYRNPYNLLFSRRGSGPPSPLWIRTCWFSSALRFISIFVFRRCL